MFHLPTRMKRLHVLTKMWGLKHYPNDLRSRRNFTVLVDYIEGMKPQTTRSYACRWQVHSGYVTFTHRKRWISESSKTGISWTNLNYIAIQTANPAMLIRQSTVDLRVIPPGLNILSNPHRFHNQKSSSLNLETRIRMKPSYINSNCLTMHHENKPHRVAP